METDDRRRLKELVALFNRLIENEHEFARITHKLADYMTVFDLDIKEARFIRALVTVKAHYYRDRTAMVRKPKTK